MVKVRWRADLGRGARGDWGWWEAVEHPGDELGAAFGRAVLEPDHLPDSWRLSSMFRLARTSGRWTRARDLEQFLTRISTQLVRREVQANS